MPDVQLTWLGHGTFRFDSPGGKRIYVDPWVSNPKIPDSEKEPERIDAIAITHGHDDHVGNTLDLVQKHADCIVVAPVELPLDDLLAGLCGMANALVLETDTLGRVVIAQLDGGLTQTAYGLLGDVITVRRRVAGVSP